MSGGCRQKTSAADQGECVLVIRLGALGDFVLSTGPFAAIRRHHAGAHITLLTTATFADFARVSPFFDEVWIDTRAPLWQIGGWLGLRKRLHGAGFSRIYDLQTSDRSGFYYRLLGPGRRPQWSGIVRGCSHPHRDPERDNLHTIERQIGQLADAGIADVPPPDLSWVTGGIGRFGLDGNYALLVPGGAAHRLAKRWPASCYGALARRLAGQGVAPVVIGGPGEAELGAEIAGIGEGMHDLTGQTSFAEIVALARGASLAVGNDTGPMHLIASTGCVSVVLFSGASDPALTAPRAPEGADEVVVLRRDDLGALGVDEVERAAIALL